MKGNKGLDIWNVTRYAIIKTILVATFCLQFQLQAIGQNKQLHPDIVSVIYPDVVTQTRGSVADITIEKVEFDPLTHLFIITGKIGGLDDNRDDSVYMKIDLMRAGKIFKNYYRSQKKGLFELSLLSTDRCKLYGLDDQYAFIYIKPPVIKRKKDRHG